MKLYSYGGSGWGVWWGLTEDLWYLHAVGVKEKGPEDDRHIEIHDGQVLAQPELKDEEVEVRGRRPAHGRDQQAQDPVKKNKLVVTAKNAESVR